MIGNISEEIIEDQYRKKYRDNGFSDPLPVIPQSSEIPAPRVGVIRSLVNREVGFGKELRLRPHQIRALEQIEEALNLEQQVLAELSKQNKEPDISGVNVVAMPVGSGKTRLMVATLGLLLKKGLYAEGDKIIVMSHMDQIYEQRYNNAERSDGSNREKQD